MADKKHSNKFWQALKRVITRDRVWKVLKIFVEIGRVIVWIIRLFEGENTE